MKRLKFDRVVIITLIAATVSMALALIVLSNVKNQLIRVSTQEYTKQQAIVAGQVAETLSNNFVNLENQLRVMASMPDVQNIDDAGACNTKLAELLQINQRQLGNLARVNEQGTFVCSVNPALIGQDSRRYGTYITDLIHDPEHKPVLGPMTRPVGADTLAAGLHIPVYQDGNFRGTLGGALYFNKFQDGYLRNIKFGNTGYAVLMDDNGDILYHPQASQSGQNLLNPKILSNFKPESTMRKLLQDVQAGKSGTFEYQLGGMPKLGLYKTFKIPEIDRHWSVIVTIPTEDLDEAIDQAGINRIFIILLTLFATTIALLTFLSIRNILRSNEIQRLKNDFISITSHQLRTPATIVKQNLGIVKDGFVTTQADRQKFIAAAYQSNENQLSIIENILSVSRLEAGKLQLQKEKMDVRALVTKSVQDIRFSAREKKHHLRLHAPKKPVYMEADPTKLAMTVENLLSNAVKYTPEGGFISLTLTQTGQHTIIAVKDSGKGIARHDIPQLFQRFNRLHGDETSHVPGTGLGLYLTKNIVELHGGTISVTSQPDHGSTFTIQLPLR